MAPPFESEIQEYSLRIPYSIRGFIGNILPYLFLAINGSYILLTQGKISFKMSHLFYVNPLSLSIAVSLLMILYYLYKITYAHRKIFLGVVVILSISSFLAYINPNISIPKEYVDNYLYLATLVGFLGTLYYVIYARTAYITVNERALIINEGVFFRKRDATDLSEIKDRDVYRSFLDQILGLAHMRIGITRGEKFNLLIDHITKNDMDKLFEFLLANSFSTYREYKITQDRLKRNNGQSPKRGDIIEDEDLEE